MKVTSLPCGNVDSCSPGTTHYYPAPGEVVVTALETTAHIRGEEDDLTVVAGAALIVAYVEPEMHCIGSVLIDGREILVPMDDLDWPEEFIVTKED